MMKVEKYCSFFLTLKFNWMRIAFALFSLTTLLSCTVSQEKVSASPRLYIFDCGRLDYTDISAFGVSNDDTAVREMFVPCYLVEHAGKRLIWDAGLPLALVGAGTVNPAPGMGFIMSYKRSLLDQLAELDLGVDDIDYLALSHLHFDHAGAANSFNNSIWIMQQVEYDVAINNPESIAGAQPQLFSELKNSETLLLNGDYDVFGDGKVKIISTPGHTVGHQVLLVDLANTGKLLLSGDLYHFRVTRTLNATPIFNYNREQTLRSMQKVETLLKETGATLWIEHDMKLANTIDKSPSFYD